VLRLLCACANCVPVLAPFLCVAGRAQLLRVVSILRVACACVPLCDSSYFVSVSVAACLPICTCAWLRVPPISGSVLVRECVVRHALVCGMCDAVCCCPCSRVYTVPSPRRCCHAGRAAIWSPATARRTPCCCCCCWYVRVVGPCCCRACQSVTCSVRRVCVWLAASMRRALCVCCVQFFVCLCLCLSHAVRWRVCVFVCLCVACVVCVARVGSSADAPLRCARRACLSHRCWYDARRAARAGPTARPAAGPCGPAAGRGEGRGGRGRRPPAAAAAPAAPARRDPAAGVGAAAAAAAARRGASTRCGWARARAACGAVARSAYVGCPPVLVVLPCLCVVASLCLSLFLCLHMRLCHCLCL
jgi:hypothetical protein